MLHLVGAVIGRLLLQEQPTQQRLVVARHGLKAVSIHLPNPQLRNTWALDHSLDSSNRDATALARQARTVQAATTS